MADNKVLYVCVALVFIAACICFAQCAPALDQAYVDRITACVGAGGTYIEGNCLQTCRGDN